MLVTVAVEPVEPPRRAVAVEPVATATLGNPVEVCRVAMEPTGVVPDLQPLGVVLVEDLRVEELGVNQISIQPGLVEAVVALDGLVVEAVAQPQARMETPVEAVVVARVAPMQALAE